MRPAIESSEFFNRAKGELLMPLNQKEMRSLAQLLDSCECRLVIPPAGSTGSTPRLELHSLVDPKQKPVSFNFQHIRPSYRKQVLSRVSEDKLELLREVDHNAVLVRVLGEDSTLSNDVERPVTEVIQRKDSSSSDSSFEEESVQAHSREHPSSNVRDKACYTTDEVQRGHIRIKVLELLREQGEAEISPRDMRQLLDKKYGINEPENSVKELLKEFCDGKKSKRDGLLYTLKEEFRLEHEPATGPRRTHGRTL